MGKMERRFLGHYIDASMSSGTPTYVRLGKDIEELNIEMNANVETKRNILGEVSTNIDGYEPSSSVEPFYADEDDPLYKELQKIIDDRKVLDSLMTTAIEVHLWEGSGTSFTAYRQGVMIEVISYGGDTTGYQIPFNIYYVGERTKGKFDTSTKVFTPDSAV